MLFEIRADIGTAETPALPMSGLIFLPFGRNRLNTLTKSTPDIEAMINAIAPRKKIFSVSKVKNSEACVDAPTVRPSSITMMSLRALLAVLARRVVTPLSRSRLPKKSMPSNGRADGTTKQVRSKPTIGNMIFSFCDTARAGFILITRSFFVVSRRMIGGWISGTRAI